MLPTDNATGNFVRVVQRRAGKDPIRKQSVARPLLPGLSARVDIDQGNGS
jgi:membrane fusion protein (multidrug efflux system)